MGVETKDLSSGVTPKEADQEATPPKVTQAPKSQAPSKPAQAPKSQTPSKPTQAPKSKTSPKPQAQKTKTPSKPQAQKTKTPSKPTQAPILSPPQAPKSQTSPKSTKNEVVWLKHVGKVLEEREKHLPMNFTSKRKMEYLIAAGNLWKQKYGTSNPVTDLSSLEAEFVEKKFPSERSHTSTAVEVGSALPDAIRGDTVKVASRRRLAHSTSAAGHRGDK